MAAEGQCSRQAVAAAKSLEPALQIAAHKRHESVTQGGPALSTCHSSRSVPHSPDRSRSCIFGSCHVWLEPAEPILCSEGSLLGESVR